MLFVFDIDDTLYDQQAAFIRAVQSIDIAKEHVDFVDLYKLIKIYGDESFSQGFNQNSLQKMQVYRIKRALKDYEIQISDKKALKFQEAFESYQNEIELFDGITDIFDFLVDNKQQIGIITNGTIVRQSRKIARLGLHNWISDCRILISEEVGISKPQRAIFSFFENTLEDILTKDKIIYIGDNYENDMIGAKSVNWKTIWTNYRNYPIDESNAADFIVQTPKELFQVIQLLLDKGD